MYCAKCGSPLPDANRFCNSCGSPVKAPPPGPSPAVAAAPPAAAWQPASAAAAAAASPAAAWQPAPAPAPAHPAAWQPAPYQQQAPVAAAQGPVAGGPMPPDMHWALVWVLASVTMGIVGLVWIFKQANFVKQIDPASKAKKLMVLGLLGIVAMFVVVAGGAGIALAAKSPEIMALVFPLMALINIGCTVLWLVAVFGMRSSLLRHYNTVEPIGLRLSGAMTFFFNMLYFQYHFSRIAEWKRTGVLRA